MDLKDINLMNDALFKAMMCHENNRELVVDFIHSITGIEKEILRKGEFIGGEEITKRKTSTKKQMTDVSVRLEDKRRVIIEMNQSDNGSGFDKNDLYAFSVAVELSHKNMKKYPKVTLINIDNFNYFKTKRPILNFVMKDEEEHIESDMIKSIHLVLANINNPKYNIDKEIKKFARFLKERDLEKLAEEFRGDEKYMAAIRTVEDLTTDERFIGYYDYEEAKEEELWEAKEYALEEGIEQGLEQGREEGAKQKAIEVAKKLIIEGMEPTIISKCTNLPLEEIEKLIESDAK